MTTLNRSILSFTEQLTFFCEKLSLAAPNTATSLAPAASLRNRDKN